MYFYLLVFLATGPELSRLTALAVLVPIIALSMVIVVAVLVALFAGAERSCRALSVLRELLAAMRRGQGRR